MVAAAANVSNVLLRSRQVGQAYVRLQREPHHATPNFVEQAVNMAPCHLPDVDGTVDASLMRSVWQCEGCKQEREKSKMLVCDGPTAAVRHGISGASCRRSSCKPGYHFKNYLSIDNDSSPPQHDDMGHEHAARRRPPRPPQSSPPPSPRADAMKAPSYPAGTRFVSAVDADELAKNANSAALMSVFMSTSSSSLSCITIVTSLSPSSSSSPPPWTTTADAALAATDARGARPSLSW
ncbi:hypothetical protein RI054_24g103440 [Pseudoscourfieldia marina]